MDIPDAQYIKEQKYRGDRVIKPKDGAYAAENVTIYELELKGGSFPFALIMTRHAQPNFMLGFSGFVTRHSLTDSDPSIVELRMQKTDPEFYRWGVAKTLLGEARALARERGQPLILHPERPPVLGYPLNDDELRAMYLRNGFREFTDDEVSRHAEKLLEHRLTSALWFEGFDHQTLQLTGKKRYSMSGEEYSLFAPVPLEQKKQLIGLLWATRGPNYATIDSTLEHNKWTVRKHLIAKED